MRRLLLLSHHDLTGPSAFTPVLDAHRHSIPWEQIDVGDDALPTDLDDVAGLLVMGGPQSTTDLERHPELVDEMKHLTRAVEAGIPVLGVCLGAQLLGLALGGEVARRRVPEIGLLPLRRTAAACADPVFERWTDDSPALLIHEDEVTELPPGSVPLLHGSDGVPAWSLGSAHAVQFHPEVPTEQLASWLDLDSLRAQLERTGLERDDVLRDAARHESVVLREGERLLQRWLRGLTRSR
ncbi:type 1 glutamine amidotransferase [Nitriliruptor alkaliphilus]|uniref:type 1 glutamine amidotransferase n=1 Tax=Nitriliruptor alkaliphilus TaxID=427918 RepID=UPI000B07BDA7|nr:gamma-glutamyl-gamma-aminobutyrate hydrolase family protein [Nitriliruptor alkaliphilus]